MKNLIIIGAGGMGRDIFSLSKECFGYGTEFVVKGFLDYNMSILDCFNGYPPILGDDDTYIIEPDDVFICAIGTVDVKVKSVKKLLSKGAEFITLIHKTAHIYQNAKIGIGCIIQPNVTIASEAKVGEHTMIQNYAVVGHDTSIGDFCRLDCMVMCVGGTIIKDCVTIHTSAVINHNVVIGQHAKIGACSFVIKNVLDNQTVFGVPARILPIPKVE